MPAITVPPPILRVWLMPGHGMSNAHVGVYDPGAQADCGDTEHEIVTAVADEVLTALDASPHVHYSVLPVPVCSDHCAAHNHPTYAHLFYVVKYVNEQAVPFDAILALHMDASGNKHSQGVSVYYSKHAPKRHNQAADLANTVAGALGRQVFGVFRSDESQHTSLSILDNTKPAAFLIELGFITNDADLAAVKANGAAAVRAAIECLTGGQ